MALYTRRQLLLVLALVVAAGAGLAIDHWRRARPDLVERLERLDRDERRPTPAEASPRRPGEVRGGPAGRARRRVPRAPRRAVAPPASLDVNRASVPDLTRLPGLGPVLAARIVQARPFATLDELSRVRGLRRATLERLRPLLAAPP